MSEKPIILNSNFVHRGFLNIRIDDVETAQGKRGTYTVIVPNSDAVIILAQNKEGKFLISKEYRHGVQQYVFCSPGGNIDKNETPHEAAKRELLEETGYLADNLILMASSFPTPSILSQTTYFFFASNVKKVQNPSPDPLESIEVNLFSKEEIINLIKEQKPLDAMLLANLFYYDLIIKN